MKKYKVAQLCGQEIAALRTTDKHTERTRLQLEQAEAVAAAVEALSRLHSRETKAKLQAFSSSQRNLELL